MSGFHAGAALGVVAGIVIGIVITLVAQWAIEVAERARRRADLDELTTRYRSNDGEIINLKIIAPGIDEITQ